MVLFPTWASVDGQSVGKEYLNEKIACDICCRKPDLGAIGPLCERRKIILQPSPIEQPLVSEGEYAVELATALNLTSSHDEAAAENALASINIAPRNGWISDYPMTPDIIAEVRDSTARSASAGSLAMSEADAAGVVDGVNTAMNLPVKAGGETYGAETGSRYSSGSSSEYESMSAPLRRRFPNIRDPLISRIIMAITDLPSSLIIHHHGTTVIYMIGSRAHSGGEDSGSAATTCFAISTGMVITTGLPTM